MPLRASRGPGGSPLQERSDNSCIAHARYAMGWERLRGELAWQWRGMSPLPGQLHTKAQQAKSPHEKLAQGHVSVACSRRSGPL